EIRANYFIFFFFPAEDGIRDFHVTGVQTCALPIFSRRSKRAKASTRICVGAKEPKSTSVPAQSKTRASRRTAWVERPSRRVMARSEERRVGKGRRSGRSRDR